MIVTFTKSKVTFDVGSFVTTILGTDIIKVWYEVVPGTPQYYLVHVERKNAEKFTIDLRSGLPDQLKWSNDLFGAKKCVDDISAIAGECCNPFDGLIVQGPQGAQGLQGTLGPVGPGGALGYYGAFYDTTDQTAALVDTGYPFKLNTTAESNGVSIVNNGLGQPTEITVSAAGTYNFQFSAQFANASTSEEVVDIWFKKNGTDIPESDSQFTIHKRQGGTDGYHLPAWNFVVTLAANDYIEIYWATSDTAVSILADPANLVHPAIPSIIVTVTQVMYTQLGPQGAQGIQGTQGVQGNRGLQGLDGTQGTQGPQGLQGTQGIQGDLGIQGTQGAQGLQGPQGTQGVQGTQGPQGTQGVQGAQGIQGTQGIQGVQGAEGLQGVQGIQGLVGIQGTTGAGTQGAQGAQGPQGLQGIQGPASANTPQFITYTGGNQVRSATTLADVDSSAGWSSVSPGFYSIQLVVVYQSVATTTGIQLSINGTATIDYLGIDVGYSTLTTDGGNMQIRAFDGGLPAPSTRTANVDLTATLTGYVNVTATGNIVLRYASEVSASNVTVKNVFGVLQRH